MQPCDHLGIVLIVMVMVRPEIMFRMEILIEQDLQFHAKSALKVDLFVLLSNTVLGRGNDNRII